MTPKDNLVADAIVETLRASRVALAANEISNRVGATVLDVTMALSKLEGSGDIVSECAGLRGRRYYRLRGREI